MLVDGDFALPESDAILWYLGEKYPDAKLLPRLDGSAGALQARAQILRFLGIASTAIYPAYSDWWNATNSDDPAKRSPAGADAALAKVTRALGVLEKTLAVRRAFGWCVFARRRRERVDHVFAQAPAAGRSARRPRALARLVRARDRAARVACGHRRLTTAACATSLDDGSAVNGPTRMWVQVTCPRESISSNEKL